MGIPGAAVFLERPDGPREEDLEDDCFWLSSVCLVLDLVLVTGSSAAEAGLSWLWPLLDIASSCFVPFLDDLVDRGEAAEGVKAVLVVFCRFDRRADVCVGGGDWSWSAPASGSAWGGLESGRADTLRFLDFAGVFEAEARAVSSWRSDSAASLAEERVTLEDMCVNG